MNASPQNKQFYKLFQLNDLNERAFGYYDHCLKGSEGINEKFLQNMELTSNLLVDEAAETLDWTPQYVVSQILKRREEMQDKLYYHYKSKGCHSSEAELASQHYRMMSGSNAEDIKVYFFKGRSKARRL